MSCGESDWLPTPCLRDARGQLTPAPPGRWIAATTPRICSKSARTSGEGATTRVRNVSSRGSHATPLRKWEKWKGDGSTSAGGNPNRCRSPSRISRDLHFYPSGGTAKPASLRHRGWRVAGHASRLASSRPLPKRETVPPEGPRTRRGRPGAAHAGSPVQGQGCARDRNRCPDDLIAAWNYSPPTWRSHDQACSPHPCRNNSRTLAVGSK